MVLAGIGIEGAWPLPAAGAAGTAITGAFTTTFGAW